MYYQLTNNFNMNIHMSSFIFNLLHYIIHWYCFNLTIMQYFWPYKPSAGFYMNRLTLSSVYTGTECWVQEPRYYIALLPQKLQLSCWQKPFGHFSHSRVHRKGSPSPAVRSDWLESCCRFSGRPPQFVWCTE